FVGARQRRRIEIGADQSLRRAGFLDFGDQRVFAGLDLGVQRPGEATRRGGRGRRALDLGGGTRALGRRDLLALIGLDLAQHIGHKAFEPTPSRSSRPSASPESSDLLASAAPSFRSLARPATTSAAAAFSTAMSRKGPFTPLSTAISALALVS